MSLLKLQYIKSVLSLALALLSVVLLAAPAALGIPLLSASPNPLTEGALNGSYLYITLPAADGTFSVATAPTAAFALNNAPTGMTVSSATINTVSSATLQMAFNGTTFSSDIDNFNVTLDSSVLVTGADLTTANLSILSDHAPPEVIISATGGLQESSLDNKHLNLALEHDRFVDSTLSRSNFILNNAPAGLSVGGVVFSTVTGATLILDYNGTDFYNDYPNFSVSVAGDELLGGSTVTSNQLTIQADTNSDNCFLSDLAVNGTTVSNFSAAVRTYTYILNAGDSTVPVVTATTQDPNASVAITQATSVTGTAGQRTATAIVTAQDGVSHLTYTVTFARTPQVLSTVPADGAVDVNENEIYSREINGQTYYFLQVVFNDPDGSLTRSSSFLELLRSSKIYAEGGSQSSMIDRDLISYISALEDPDAFISQYIFVSGSGSKTLFVPVRRLGTQVTYSVELSAGLVEYADGADNTAVTWSFATMAVPTLSRVSLGSVPEDYDESEPIILDGGRFNDSVTVYFNDTKAYRVKSATRTDGTEYLKVWLPRGSKHLEPGIYDITVKNGDDHESTLLGSFCVVASSDIPLPADGQQIIGEDDLGNVIARLANSESILELSSSYCVADDLDIDLDELMGNDVMVRKIVFPAHIRARIDFLKTYSQWGSVAFYNLQSDTTGTNNQACITLGRLPYTQTATLKSRLGSSKPKSDFFQVSGDFFDVDAIEIHLPYRLSDGNNLRMLRYDPSSRSFQNASASVDTSSGVVIATNVQPGIFIVVE